MSHRTLTFGLSSTSLVLLLACGGSSRKPTPTATTIAYTDPTGVPATSYCLKKNSVSGTHVILDLYGPVATVTGSGVVLTLNLDTTNATWGTTPVVNGGLFTTNTYGAPIFKHKLSGNSNDTLQVVVTERGVASAKNFAGPLLQFALDLKPGETAPGTTIHLSPVPDKSKAVIQGNADPVTLDLRIGTLTAQ